METIGVARDDIEDDTYGTYSPLFQELGRAAAVHPTELIYAALKVGFTTPCFDGQYFFDTDHPDEAGNSHSNTGGGSGAAWALCDLTRVVKPILFQRRIPYELQSLTNMDDEQAFMLDLYRYGVRGRCVAGYGLWQLAYGSKQDLTEANYATARQTLLEMKGDQGRLMGVMPTHLIVPPSLEKKAREILVAERTTGGETNVWQGSATLHVTPWMA